MEMLSLISLNKTVLAKLQNYRKNVAFFKLLRMNLYFKGGEPSLITSLMCENRLEKNM